MQSHDWNDLKFVLALYRAGKLKEAGSVVGVSDTTVTRRIAVLEQRLGTALFLRNANGRYEPTDATLQILPYAEAVELANLAIAEISGETASSVAGCVRISSVPFIVNRVLVPKLAPLTNTYSQLRIELVPASENLDLSKREADLALRFSRPTDGGLRTKAQKLGALNFGAYVARKITTERAGALRWIAYDEAHSGLPQARWLEKAIANGSRSPACVRVADVETALEAVANGLGKSLLPRVVADADSRLKILHPEETAKIPAREVWLLSHIDQTSSASISAVKDWLADLRWD